MVVGAVRGNGRTSVGGRAPGSAGQKAGAATAAIIASATGGNVHALLLNGAPALAGPADAATAGVVVVRTGSGNLHAAVGFDAESESSFKAETVSAVIPGRAASGD